MKSEKGLTLVMLVITIVVLWILTAVLIFMVMDGGFADSKNATNTTNTTVTTQNIENENKIEEPVPQTDVQE